MLRAPRLLRASALTGRADAATARGGGAVPTTVLYVLGFSHRVGSYAPARIRRLVGFCTYYL